MATPRLLSVLVLAWLAAPRVASAGVLVQNLYATRIYKTGFYLNGGVRTLIETRNSSTFTNPVLHLLDASGHQVAFNDDLNSGTRESRITYTPPATGWFVLVVRNHNPGLPGMTSDLYRDGNLLVPQVPVGGALVTQTPWTLASPGQFFYAMSTSREDRGPRAADTILYLIENNLIREYDDDGGAGDSARISPRYPCSASCSALVGAYPYSAGSEGPARLIRDALQPDTDASHDSCRRWGGLGCDRDDDGLSDQLEQLLGTDPLQKDTDRDGLSDGVEVLGRGKVLLPWEGADPKVRDIFVQVNYMVDSSAATPHSHYVGSAPVVAARLRQSFANNFAGAKLHIDVAGPVPHASVITNGSASVSGDTTTFDALRAQGYFLPDREGIYRWAVAAHFYKQNGNGSSGYSYSGDRFVMTFGGWSSLVGTDNENTGTLLHELGHSLGLSHNGNGNNNGRNSMIHKSVMNYRYQVAGIGDGAPDTYRYSTDQEACAPFWTSPKLGCGGFFSLGCDCTFNEYGKLDLSGGGEIAAGVLEAGASAPAVAATSRTARVAPPPGVGARLLGLSMRVALSTGAREGKDTDPATYDWLRRLENTVLEGQYLEPNRFLLGIRRTADLLARGYVLGRDFAMGPSGPEWIEADGERM